MAFSPNGKWLATGDAGGHTYLWDLAVKTNQNKPAQSLNNPTSAWLRGQERGLFGGLRPAQQHDRHHRLERPRLYVDGALTRP